MEDNRRQVKTSRRAFGKPQPQKKSEKERESILGGRMKRFPALLEAYQIGRKVSCYGFDWKGPLEALQKVKEETHELEKAIKEAKEEEASREMGDLFFSLTNVSRLLGLNPEIALRSANRKFIKRFKFLEKKLKEQGKEMGKVSLEEMDEVWEEAKNMIR